MKQEPNQSKEKVEYFKGQDLNKSGFNEAVAPMPERKGVKKGMKKYSDKL